MPIVTKSNNRVLPANQRSVDVARQALADIIPVQQRRYHNAFLVEGYECQVYNALTQGQLCSCQGHNKAVSTLLNDEGKMPFAKQNELLTGLSFKVNLYGNSPAPRDDYRQELGKGAPLRSGQINEGPKSVNSTQPPFEVVSRGLDNAFAGTITDDEDAFGSNGPNHDLDDKFSDFDSGSLIGLGDSACAICFGRGYVGGFSLLGGWRQVFSTQWDAKRVEGTIEINKLPHAFYATEVEFDAVLPRGFKSLDRLAVWNNTRVVDGATIYIDGTVVDHNVLYQVFDGLSHKIKVKFDDLTDWTHLEFQVDTGNEARLEFPRLTKGFDASKLDGLESIQINMSPIIPHVGIRDLVFESTFGKGFVLTSAQLWNSEQRKVLGWDCQARVIQPNEILNLLPRRRRAQEQKTTRMVRDNQDGGRRT